MALFLDFNKNTFFPKLFPNEFSFWQLLWETVFLFCREALKRYPVPAFSVESADFSEMFSKACGIMFENVDNRNFVRILRRKFRSRCPVWAKNKENDSRNRLENEVCPHIHRSFQQLVENRFGNFPTLKQVKYGYPKSLEKSCGKLRCRV